MNKKIKNVIIVNRDTVDINYLNVLLDEHGIESVCIIGGNSPKTIDFLGDFFGASVEDFRVFAIGFSSGVMSEMKNLVCEEDELYFVTSGAYLLDQFLEGEDLNNYIVFEECRKYRYQKSELIHDLTAKSFLEIFGKTRSSIGEVPTTSSTDLYAKYNVKKK